MLQRTIKAAIRPGDQSGYIAECLEIAVVTQGRTLDEVTRNLREAVELHLADEDLEALGLIPEPTYAANATDALIEAGVTGIRTAGVPHYIDVALKHAFDTGQLVGPRIRAGGWFLTRHRERPAAAARAQGWPHRRR